MGEEPPVSDARSADTRPRVAVLSVHTSPVDQPGTGDSGGMNVYIRAVAERLARAGAQVDLFTRCRGGIHHDVRVIAPGASVVPIKAGPCTPLPKAELPRFLPEFLGGVLRHGRENALTYDLVHSHYWLSGWVGRAVKELWSVPMVTSFHTLGKVKNYSLAPGERAEPPVRIDAESRAIASSDLILSPTPAEAVQLVGLYRAEPDRLRIVPPGVDHVLFTPRSRDEARGRLHLSGLRLALYVGRIQPHKGPDVAVRALAEAVARDPAVTEHLMLAVVGGPSGERAEVARLMELATALGVADRVVLFPPQTQERLADFYAAADVVLVPSRSESFGLVALEAQACGVPVVAASVGGLPFVVDHDRTGLLVEGHDPGDHAEAMLRILRDDDLRAALGANAAREALRFTWDTTAGQMLSVYRELV